MCKLDFIAVLEAVLVCADLDVKGLSLVDENTVEVAFVGGGRRLADITADSHSAIIKDVLKCCC